MTAFTPASRDFFEHYTHLSLEARALCVYLDTFTEDWTIREAHICKALGIGRRTYQRVIKELKDKAPELLKDGATTARGKNPPKFTGRAQVRNRTCGIAPLTNEVTTNAIGSTSDSPGAKPHLGYGELAGDEGCEAPSPSGSSLPGPSLPRGSQPSTSEASSSPGPSAVVNGGDQGTHVRTPLDFPRCDHCRQQGTLCGYHLKQAPNVSHGSPQGHTGPRWYECQECGGQFEYLRRGGTCRECEASING